jgi:hypothetical protein
VNNNTRILKYKDVSSAEELRKMILNSLKLPLKSDSFENKIGSYFQRQPKLKVRIQLDKKQIFGDIENRITREQSSRKIPEDYDFENPLNRWNIETGSKPNKESIKEILNLELKEMKSLFSILEQFFEIDFI